MGHRDLTDLHEKLAFVAPIDSVSIGVPGDRNTWVIRFKESATDPQKAAAASALQAFDINAPTKSDVVSEARRRIRSVYGVATDEEATEMRSATASRVLQYVMQQSAHAEGSAPALTQAEIDESADLQAKNARCIVIENRCSVLAANPPADYTNDAHWS